MDWLQHESSTNAHRGNSPVSKQGYSLLNMATNPHLTDIFNEQMKQKTIDGYVLHENIFEYIHKNLKNCILICIDKM